MLKGILSEDAYKHFLLFYCAMRILLHEAIATNPELVDIARGMLVEFVKNVASFYGRQSCVYNVHNLLHIAHDVGYFKLSLNPLSAFAFENYLGSLKGKLRRFSRPLSQICKRLSENSAVKVVPREHFNNIRVNQTFSTLLVSNATVHLNGKDNYVLLQNNRIIKIILFVSETMISGYVSSTLQNFYEHPIESSKVGVYQVNKFSDRISTWNCTDLVRKVILLPYSNRFTMCNYLH